jgi:hypothetical protein
LRHLRPAGYQYLQDPKALNIVRHSGCLFKLPSAHCCRVHAFLQPIFYLRVVVGVLFAPISIIRKPVIGPSRKTSY